MESIEITCTYIGVQRDPYWLARYWSTVTGRYHEATRPSKEEAIGAIITSIDFNQEEQGQPFTIKLTIK